MKKKKVNKLVEAMKQFAEDLEKDNLDNYRITEVSKNNNGSYTFVEKHKGKIRKFTKNFKDKE